MANIPTTVGFIGSNSPNFIIKSGATYYVTQSVAAYDPAKAATPEEKADVAAVEKMFGAARDAGAGREAVELTKTNNVMSFQATNQQ